MRACHRCSDSSLGGTEAGDHRDASFLGLRERRCRPGSADLAAGKRRADCRSHCRRRNRRSPSLQQRHRDADALLLGE